jgi:tetratricopeptide (TPR) repeat protein
MSLSNGVQGNQSGASTQAIERAVWMALAGLVCVALAFAGYYVWDRYVHLGDRSAAERCVEEAELAVVHDPQNPGMRVALADSYLAAGDYAASFEQANQVLVVYPDNLGALLIAGVAAVRMGELEEALDPLQSFVQLRKDQPMAGTDTALETAYYFLGECYVRLELYAEAIAVLEDALEINSTDADSLYQLGLAHQARGDLERALESFHRAVRFVPDFVEAYSGMAQCYAALGQASHESYARGMVAYSLTDDLTAQTYLEDATESLPDFAPAYLGLGLTYERLGRLEEALTALQYALDLDTNDFVAQQAFGRIQSIVQAGN